MQMIPLTQGKLAKVSDVDYARLSQFKWRVQKNVRKTRTIYYAVRSLPWSDGKRRAVYMHSEIAFVAGFSGKIDHRDGDGLNDQRENLRPATGTQNNGNRRKQVGCSSRFKGVCFQRGKWLARLGVAGCQHLGSFQTEEEAALAYNKAAKAVFGQFALLNKVENYAVSTNQSDRSSEAKPGGLPDQAPGNPLS